MTIDTNFNVNPYYDDFNEDKKFLRMLFKPGFAVQARELTQAQTILQKQIERFGNHVFKNGSVVTGGATFLQDVTYLKLDTAYSGTDIVANNFIGTTIVDNTSAPTKRAEVLKVFEADEGTGDPKTLMVRQIYGDAFTSGSTIYTNETTPYLANISTSGVGTGQVFSIDEGVFYYEGYFVKTDKQTVATSKYSNTTANAKIGFEITESLVSSTSDTSLLDPAQDASNYQAPGADRFKIDMVLTTRSLTSEDTTQFIELARVENGTLTRNYRFPIYSVLEETLARRTYDESGNYTVRPFKISLETNAANTANMDVILSPGKAYVYGFEYETVAPTRITVEKPRDTQSVQNKRLAADYGNFLYTTNHTGSQAINDLSIIDLHCVNVASINTTSTASISNTKIGTARVASILYDTATDISDYTTYTYKSFLFDVKVSNNVVGNVNTATSTTVTIGDTGAGQIFTDIEDAYIGATIRITDGPGSSEAPKVITAFDATTQTITVVEPFIATLNTQSVFSIDFEISETESLATFSGTTEINSSDVDTRSKDLASTYNYTFLSDSDYQPLIVPLGERYIADNSISDFSFSYKRLYTSQTFTANASPALSTGSGETLATASSTSAINQNYQVVVSSSGTSPYSVGEIISADKITDVDTVTKKITVADGQNMTANIIATIDFTLASGNPAKVKTLVTANATVQTTGGESVNTNGAIIYASQGQTTIQANNVIKTPGTAQTLYVSDVNELISVYDYNGANVANTGYTDVTNRYTLDNGQRNTFYDHASIKLKPGYSAPNGPLVVRYNKYSSSGAGFFTVDSYPTYGTIPVYTSPILDREYELRDCLDFRPVRKDATAAIGTAIQFDVDSSTTGPKIPENGSDIILDHSYYLPRIDKVVLSKNKTFEVIKGISSSNPFEPKNKEDSMNLYILAEPAYLANTSDVDVQYINNRRYTMRDIGNLDKRIGNLEYYTSLSLLEQDALNKQDLTILDSTNLPRFKNGIIVDSFKGHSVADVTNSEYKASIDPTKQELRPSFNISSYGLAFDSANSTNYLEGGPFITVDASITSFVEQDYASKTMNINPFNIVNYIGKIKLDPPSDVWVDTETKPDVLVNLAGDKDAWDFLLEGTQSAFQVEWGNWETNWTGNEVVTESLVLKKGRWVDGPKKGRGNVVDPNAGTLTTTTEVSTGQSRTGIATSISAETITQSLGDRIIDVSVIPYMRNLSVLFTASDFKPDTVLYPFFDNIPVEKYVARANKFVLANNNLSFGTQRPRTGGGGQIVTIYNDDTSTANGTAIVVKESNNTVFVVNVNPTTSFNITNGRLAASLANVRLVPGGEPKSYDISEYYHYSGGVQSATSNTIVLQIDASGAYNEPLYGNTANSNIVSIVSGTGAGQQATISSYDAGTRTITISSTWSTTPDTTSVYSIGRLTTTRSGDVAGIYNIPAGTFRTGEKLFRLIDDANGDIPSSSTNGDASFFAQGLLQTQEEVLVSTIQPTIQRTSVSDERVTTTTSSIDTPVAGWYDPLAQTFLVSPQQHPQGIFLDKVRVCFKTKDDTVPVTVQLRPTVNGYPSSTVIYPYGSVTLTPDKINVTDSPDFDDPTKYTDFVFDTPVYLLPGEHSFVLVSNCNKYETYVAEVGKIDITSGLQISEQPYGGSFFMSQNGSTWTADQNLDISFRLFRKVFDTGTPAVAQFLVDTPSANVKYDLLNLITSQVTMANTSVNYTFLSEKDTIGGLTTFKPIVPLSDYSMNDGDGSRVLNPTTGNTSLILKATMSTLNPDISPFLDITRFGGIFVENTINNLPLQNTDFVIEANGTGYANSSDVTVTITGGGGSGAVATANVVSNTIVGIELSDGGSGYTTSPTITITPGSGGGSGAVITYNGEDKKSGGNSDVRYLTRRVTLADGFDSGDLRIYLTAYKPSNSGIHVYYKVLSASDPDVFNDKNYVLMREIGNPNFISTTLRDYRELTFAPGTADDIDNKITYTSGGTSYNSFKTFAIKIVMSNSVTVDVPKIRDLRVVALPAEE